MFMNVDFETFGPLFKKQLDGLTSTIIKPSNDFVVNPPRLTVVAFLPKEASNLFKGLYSELERYNQNDSLFFAPLDTLHITIIGGFSLDVSAQDLKNSLVKHISSSFLVFNLVSISSVGTNASPFALPVGFSLKDIREKIRKDIGEYGISYTTDYANYIGWINILRYTGIPNDAVKDIYYKYVDKIWGRVEFKELHICKVTNKILTKKDIIETISL